jgi:serine/threonine protein kinase
LWDEAKVPKLNKKELLNILAQIFASLIIAQEKAGFCHGDLHAGNVLVIRLKEEVEITYVIGKKKYTLKTNLIPKIIDYGFCRVQIGKVVLTALEKDIDRINQKGPPVFKSRIFQPVQWVKYDDRQPLPRLFDICRLIDSIPVTLQKDLNNAVTPPGYITPKKLIQTFIPPPLGRPDQFETIDQLKERLDYLWTQL